MFYVQFDKSARIRELREKGVDLFEAKKRVEREMLRKAAREAETVDHLRSIILKMLDGDWL